MRCHLGYSIPTFVLPVDIYTGPWPTKVYRLSVLGNLGQGRRINPQPIDGISLVDTLSPESQLLLPALTDVRDFSCLSGNDVVEVPAGSGRWYQVMSVDDAGKGFSNEHRIAWICKISDRSNSVDFPGLYWPTPIP